MIIDDFPYCYGWKYFCRMAVACIPTEYITLDRCLWEELTLRQRIRKNGEIIEHYLIQ
jgi:hypothetical protein